MIRIRRMTPEDAMQVVEIEQMCFSRPWSREALEKAAADPGALYLIAEDESSGAVAGYMGAYLILEEADINQVAVTPAYRRRGVATQIMQDFMQKVKDLGITAVTLEVRKSNLEAIGLYEKMGFVTEGIRKNFYDAPTEDACIMWKR